MRSFIWHFVCHWGLQGTHMYKHTHTFIANEWLGGWARAPPYQRKEPSSSQSKNVPAWAQKHQPLSMATDPSTSLKPHVLSHSEIGIRNMGVPLQEGMRHSHAPPFTGGGTGELNNLTSFHRTYPPLLQTLKKCNIPSLGCLDWFTATTWRAEMFTTWNVSFCFDVSLQNMYFLNFALIRRHIKSFCSGTCQAASGDNGQWTLKNKKETVL